MRWLQRAAVSSARQTTVGTVGAGWWLDYGARLTLSVNLDTHDMSLRARARESHRGTADAVVQCLGLREVWTAA
jgi:hypothetical protein